MEHKVKKTIVVTGGAGFIGSHLIEYINLHDNEYRIISIDNYSTGIKENHIKANGSNEIIYLDGETKDIEKTLEDVDCIETVFHFAEFSRIVQSFKLFENCFECNMVSTLEVIKFCMKRQIKIIYSASSSKFGNSGKDEHLSPYSWSKAKNIELIKNFRNWFGLSYEIVYFYNVYGERQIKNHPMAAVIGIFEEQYASGKPLSVVLPGTQKRDFTNVKDIVFGTYLAWKKDLNDEFMLGTGNSYSVLEVAQMFGGEINFIAERPGERLTSIIENDNAQKMLGYVATNSLEEYIEAFKKMHSK